MNEQADYETDREDGRYQTSLGFCHHLLANHTPRLAYHDGLSGAAWPTWQAAVRDKLTELMGFPEETAQPPPRRLWACGRQGYRLEKWEAYPEPSSVVPFLMLVPDHVDTEHPGAAVLCFPGSATTKELLAGEPELDSRQPANRHPERNQMALHYVRAGLAAVVLENPGTGELAAGADTASSVGRGREKLATELILLGRNYVGLSVFQKRHVLHWLRNLDYIDSERIAVSGHSLGTEPAMVMAVLDPGIRALVFNDFLCHTLTRYATMAPPADGQWQITTPLWHLIPGFQRWFDFPDLLAAVAPRPLLITEGGLTAQLRRVAGAYAAVGAADQFTYHYYPKFADAANRPRDGEPLPRSLTMAEFLERANVDVPNHCFKENLAVPWLCGVLRQS